MDIRKDQFSHHLVPPGIATVETHVPIDCAHSSIMTRSKTTSSNISCPLPTHVAIITLCRRTASRKSIILMQRASLCKPCSRSRQKSRYLGNSGTHKTKWMHSLGCDYLSKLNTPTAHWFCYWYSICTQATLSLTAYPESTPPEGLIHSRIQHGHS